MSTEDGKIIVNCQECSRTCMTVEAGGSKVIFSGIGMSVRCSGCEAWMYRQNRGGGKAF